MGVLSREKHPLQQLHLKREVGVFSGVGLFSGGYSKTRFKIRQSKIALNQTLTLKLGVTLVLTVTQVNVFINLHQKTSPPP